MYSSVKKRINVRKITSMLLVVILLFSLSGQAYAYDEAVSSDDKSDSTSYNYGYGWEDIGVAYSIGYMGAEWSSARDCWCFNFRIVGTGASREADGDDADRIRIAAMQIEGTSNTSNLALWTSSDSKYIGSKPETGTTYNYYDLAMELAGIAVSALGSEGLGYAWTAYGLVSALCSVVDDSEEQDDYIWKDWEWSSDISDTGQFFWFLADVEPNQTVQISADYMIFGPGYELLDPGASYWNLIAPGSQSKSLSANSNWNPGMMSDEEKKEYGIEEISVADVDERAEELGIPLEIVDEFYESGDEVLYYAHNLTVTVEEESEIKSDIAENSLTKESLIEEINSQIERNKLIIKAFSNIDSITQDDLTIIDKNKSEQILLETLLDDAQSVSADDSDAIESLWDELWQDILKENPAVS